MGNGRWSAPTGRSRPLGYLATLLGAELGGSGHAALQAAGAALGDMGFLSVANGYLGDQQGVGYGIRRDASRLFGPVGIVDPLVLVDRVNPKVTLSCTLAQRGCQFQTDTLPGGAVKHYQPGAGVVVVPHGGRCSSWNDSRHGAVSLSMVLRSSMVWNFVYLI